MGRILAKCVYTFKQGDTRNICCKILSNKIGNFAFESSNIKSVVIPDTVETIGMQSFCKCTLLENITIPESVKSIGYSAFNSCTNLTQITIPNSVTSIEGSAFRNCNRLTSITCLAETPPTLDTQVFDSTNNCPIYVPSGSVDAYKAATNWSTYASRIQAIPTT